MAELIKPWNDGGNLSVTYDGNGDGEAIFSSDVNEGIDREMFIIFRDTSKSISVERVVKQIGLREVFYCADGEFLLVDEGTFNVIKNGLQ